MKDEAPLNLSLAALINRLQSGELPLLDYLDELEAHFVAREPEVLAFVPEDGRFARLRRAAQALLQTYPDPANRPPLFGAPVGVKDIFHVDGFPTRGGSQLPPEALGGDEADCVTAVRRAGALILGKTVTTEFAYFAPGPTRNPHNPAHTPGGSSSGSAAAVAARLCPLAFGTQTIGSVNRPASFCGVFGYKPSYGRISKAGVIPLSGSLDHVGFFTRQTAGAEIAAGLLCQHWQTVAAERRPVLGIPAGPYLENASSEMLAHYRAICDQLAAAGFALKPIPVMRDFEEIRARHNLIVAAEAARVHADWFARFGDRYHAKTAELIQRGQSVTDAELAAAVGGRPLLRQQFTALMDAYGLDAWITPAAPGPAPKGLDSTGDPVMNLPWTHAGLPAVTLPSGFAANGLPLGVQLVGRWYGDEALLGWAAEVDIKLPGGSEPPGS